MTFCPQLPTFPSPSVVGQEPCLIYSTLHRARHKAGIGGF